MATAYPRHPQAAVRSERKNQEVGLALRNYVAEHPAPDDFEVDVASPSLACPQFCSLAAAVKLDSHV